MCPSEDLSESPVTGIMCICGQRTLSVTELTSHQKRVAHPHSVQLFGLRIQTVADIKQTENGLVPYTVQQPFGEIADVVLPEVPHR